MSWITRNSLMSTVLAVAVSAHALACTDDVLIDSGEQAATVNKETKQAKRQARLQCRIARMAAERAPIYTAALAKMGAKPKEQETAAIYLTKRAKETCKKGIPAIESKLSKRLSKLVTRVENRFARRMPEVRGTPGLFLEVLVPDLADFERRCFDGDGLTAEAMAAMSDAQFDGMMDELAWGLCGSADGASPGGAGWASWSASSGNAYATCVREGIRGHINDLSQNNCNIAGGGGTNGGDVAEPDSNPPQPDQDGDDDPTDGPAPGEGDDDSGSDGDSAGDGDAPPGSDPVETAGAIAETALGATGAVVGAAVAGIAIALAPETLGTSLVMIGPAVFLMRQGWSHFNRGLGRLGLQCPSFATDAGDFGYAGQGGMDASERGFSIADIMHTCRCEHRGPAIDTDPTGEFGDSCSGDRADRLDCIRDPYDDTGRLRRECAEMMADDNDYELSSRFGVCAVTSCGDDRVLSADCSCVYLGGGGGGHPGGGLASCDTVQCPVGTTPVPSGASCICEDVNVDIDIGGGDIDIGIGGGLGGGLPGGGIGGGEVPPIGSGGGGPPPIGGGL